MDLSTVERRLSGRSYYISLEIFAADVRRIFANCRAYNAPDSIYSRLGGGLEAFFEAALRERVVLDAPPPTPPPEAAGGA